MRNVLFPRSLGLLSLLAVVHPASANPAFPSLQVDIGCAAPAAPLGDQGADCSRLNGTTQLARITSYTAQVDPLFVETRLQTFSTNGVRALLDGNGDANT